MILSKYSNEFKYCRVVSKELELYHYEYSFDVE